MVFTPCLRPRERLLQPSAEIGHDRVAQGFDAKCLRLKNMKSIDGLTIGFAPDSMVWASRETSMLGEPQFGTLPLPRRSRSAGANVGGSHEVDAGGPGRRRLARQH